MSRHSPEIAVIGAGLSGVAVGHYLKEAGIESFTIFEKTDAVGGTWHQHTYPGLCCDVPSHIYSYSFERNPNWSHTYAPQKEIVAYFQKAAKKHGIEPHIRFETAVKVARYEDTGHWDLELENGERRKFKYLITATGSLFAPSWPRIPGVKEFGGTSWHSARWNHDYDLEGKTVAVVGSGASAIQVVPHVATKAKRLFALQRTPLWVMPRNNRAYSRWLKWKFRWIPSAQARHRERLMQPSELTLKAIQGDRKLLDILMRVGKKNISKHISDPEMQATLTPPHLPGCRRTLVSDDYYPALMQDNVELIPEAVVRVTEEGPVTSSGRELKVDAIIYCTGYRLPSYDLAVPVVGPDGKSVGEILKQRPESYRGVALPGFPNYFMINGPNGVLGHTSVTIPSEFQAEYIARIIGEATRNRTKAIEIKESVTRAYNDAIQVELQKTTWASDCKSFYKDQSGRVVSFFPGTAERMRREFQECGLDDFEQTV